MGSVNTAEIHDMVIDDDNDINDSSMVMEEDLDESYDQLKSCCSAPNDDFYIDYPGPSTLSNNVPLLLDTPMMMEDLDIDKVDGQSKLRRSGSRWIKHSKSIPNISHVGEDIYLYGSCS